MGIIMFIITILIMFILITTTMDYEGIMTNK
jgi:hypothetical protein